MSFNQRNNNKLSTNILLLFVIYDTVLLINLCLFLPCPPSTPSSFCHSLSASRAAQQSRWPVYVSSAPPSAAAAPRLHLRPPGSLHSSQPAEEDHADAVSDRPGRPGGRQQLGNRPGAASQQLGAQQQHPPRDQVTERRKYSLLCRRGGGEELQILSRRG